mmetsp:Transcript_4485/g.5827  ORF Transcript_4485/g.5827 Transcript_4485/m.5827 type:complete len:386 (-) Transcript_4485:3308-4465(-)
MPGPKMGARPDDFDEKLVREAPTFKKWEQLSDGKKLRYACRDFIKGHGDDEERLMRRIMIARRNNLRDHEILKEARARVKEPEKVASSSPASSRQRNGVKEKATEQLNPPKRKRCLTSHCMTDEELIGEMDTPAIEATRSYKAWLTLPKDSEFTYNQKYIKGREGHDWLLRKNIWRRMRYRRQNKNMVEKLKHDLEPGQTPGQQEVIDEMPPIKSDPDDSYSHSDQAEHPTYASAAAAATATQIVDQTLLSGETNNLDEADNEENIHAAVVEAAVAAVAAAESYVKQARESECIDMVVEVYPDTKVEPPTEAAVGAPSSVHNPIISDQVSNLQGAMNDHSHTPNPLVDYDGDALDVAAKLAAAASAQICKVESNEDSVEGGIEEV